jgi:hypothetical protein
MGSHATPDGVIGGARPLIGEVGGWLDAYAGQVESFFYSGRNLGAAMRSVIRRRLSEGAAPRIRVSGMSDSWLRTHETDHDKHRAEL